MHDPKVVALELRRPWPTHRNSVVHRNTDLTPRWKFHGAFWHLAGREWYWPPFITIWHNEPGGRDALTVCRAGWRWHVWHWSFQVHPLQKLRRRLLTRCAWCGGRDRKGDPVNHGSGWESVKTPWWRGEVDLFHADCLTVQQAHRACICPPGVGVYPYGLRDTGGYGGCFKCGKWRPARTASDIGSPRDVCNAILSAVPEGQRDPAAMELVGALWTSWKIRKGQAA